MRHLVHVELPRRALWLDGSTERLGRQSEAGYSNEGLPISGLALRHLNEAILALVSDKEVHGRSPT